ncbi:hypothetical protein [Janthinobacterium sp. MDT1-19]|uniref:hypothetical protein n=1 Tax=Janthinobacterium sp. MDT1-19 TaxID=1259339 RepID=UPI003F20ACD4
MTLQETTVNEGKKLVSPMTWPCITHQCGTACIGIPAAILPGMRPQKPASWRREKEDALGKYNKIN